MARVSSTVRTKVVYRPPPINVKREGPSDLSVRLKAIMKEGGLNVAELAIWFDRPYATMRCWVRSTHIPGSSFLKEVLLRVRLLEKVVDVAVKRGESVVPYALRQGDERLLFLRKLYDEARAGRFPKSNSPK